MRTPLAAALAALLAAPASAQVTLEQVREEIRKELGARPAAGQTPASAFNPAMGLVLDAAARHGTADRGAFQFRSAELNFSADADPYAKVYAIVTGREDEIEVEEAAAVFPDLPGRLSARAGRYFADFGRLPRWHDHELPFAERTESLDSFIGGEARTEGLELSHLLPLPFFLRATVGAGNKLGAENDRLEETSPAAQDGHKNGRPLDAFTYYGKLLTYLPAGDAWGVDLAVSEAYTPRQYYLGGVRTDHGRNHRALTGVDAVVRWEPGERHRRLLWGTEVFHNDERRRVDPDGAGTFVNVRRTAWGGYTYLEGRLARLWSAGAFADYAEDLDARRASTRTFGAFLNLHPSEYHRIRVQVDRRRDNAGGRADVRGLVQLTAVIGRHAHTFKDR